MIPDVSSEDGSLDRDTGDPVCPQLAQSKHCSQTVTEALNQL